MTRALPHLVVYTMPIAFAVGLYAGGAWMFAGTLYAFGLIPILDLLSGHDTADPAEDEASNPVYDLILRGWVPVHVATLALALWRVAQGDLTAVEWAGLTMSMAVVTTGGGINVAHELMHRRARLDRALAELLMSLATYTHFCVEHVHGHHKNVATPNDPATSRLGETIYAYLPRTLVGGLVSAWRIETRRVAKRGIRLGSLADRRLRYGLGIAALYGAITAAFGPVAALFFAAQSAVAWVLLETINYVEHYGLQRAEIAPGRYERTQPHHSWNATQRLTNALLFNLQRHADHHAFASRKFMELRAWPGAPELPFGYPTMVLLALVPPLWFKVMNPRVEAVRREAMAA